MCLECTLPRYPEHECRLWQHERIAISLGMSVCLRDIDSQGQEFVVSKNVGPEAREGREPASDTSKMTRDNVRRAERGDCSVGELHGEILMSVSKFSWRSSNNVHLAKVQKGIGIVCATHQIR